jgi:prepilin-type N-terminal cleavage/methylation domain-containing protein
MVRFLHQLRNRASLRQRVSCERRPPSSGFTLVEVLMVVTALAIIAGVVVPQVTSVLDDARHASMLTQLNQLTFAIERFQAEHEGRAPDQIVGQTLPQLLNKTNLAGAVGSTASHNLGPYVHQRMPVNPLNDNSQVFRSNTAPPANLELRVGWVYHPETGQIWAGMYQGSLAE